MVWSGGVFLVLWPLHRDTPRPPERLLASSPSPRGSFKHPPLTHLFPTFFLLLTQACLRLHRKCRRQQSVKYGTSGFHIHTQHRQHKTTHNTLTHTIHNAHRAPTTPHTHTPASPPALSSWKLRRGILLLTYPQSTASSSPPDLQPLSLCSPFPWASTELQLHFFKKKQMGRVISNRLPPLLPAVKIEASNVRLPFPPRLHT